MNSGYHESRLTADPKRDVVWRALWRYHFSKLIRDDDCVLDLGCGYGSFINQVVARRRIALDSGEGFPAFLAPGIEAMVGGVTELGFLPDGGVDFAFASNLFEHISQNDFTRVLNALREAVGARHVDYTTTKLSLCIPGVFRRLYSRCDLLAYRPGGFFDSQWVMMC